MDVSILIATRDRPNLLSQTLDALERQAAADLRWQVIVVDNGRTDRTPTVLARQDRSFEVVPLREPVPGKNRALNRALEVARGKLLVFVDDDIVAEPDWLRSLSEGARRWPEDSVFGGRIVPRFPPNTPSWIHDLDPDFRLGAFSGYEPAEAEGPVELEPFGGNLAIRRPVFDQVRYCEQIGPCGRDYAVGSETELMYRLRDRGYRFIYIPSATVHHIIRPEQVTMRWILRRAYRNGRKMPRLYQVPVRRTLFGVPGFLWRMLPRRWLRYQLQRFRDERERFEAGRQLYELLGRMREYRILSGERPGRLGTVCSRKTQPAPYVQTGDGCVSTSRRAADIAEEPV